MVIAIKIQGQIPDAQLNLTLMEYIVVACQDISKFAEDHAKNVQGNNSGMELVVVMVSSSNAKATFSGIMILIHANLLVKGVDKTNIGTA